MIGIGKKFLKDEVCPKKNLNRFISGKKET